jgi:Uma2 family endonuclease
MHAILTTMLVSHLQSNLPFCRVAIGGGVKPRIEADWNYGVPDITVTCEKMINGQHDVPDPVVIIELLSPSNKADTWDNVRNYATVPSIGEIVIIDTVRVHADALTRDGKGHWPPNPHVVKRGGIISTPSLKFDRPLDHAYRDTYLADS